MYKNLHEYIVHLEAEGELLRVKAPVDPLLEITEITDRMSKEPGGGKALLFEDTGTGFPVLTNMMGSDRRIAMALGVGSLDELSHRIETLFRAAARPQTSLWDKFRLLPLLGSAARWMPRNKRGRGECQEVVLEGDSIDLGALPILKCWPHDGGRFITLPMVNTIDPETGVRNVGMYRMQVFSKDTTGMHWHMHKTGARHYETYKRLGRRMPVSVCLGGDPAYTYAATAPMPDGMDEYMLAGFIRRRGVRLVKCITNDIMVPADCDFVIEGYVDPAEEKVAEGAFGDHTGFYSLPDRYPLFHVTAITHRQNAVYPATIVGIPPQEDAFIAKATEKIFLGPIKMAMLPEVRDMYLPQEGVAHNIAVLDIEKSYAGQAFKVASSLWGAGQMMFNKFMIITSVTDAAQNRALPAEGPGGSDPSLSADIRNPETIGRILSEIDVEHDLLFSRGPLDVLDHSAPELGFGGKLAVDATRAFNTGTFPETRAGQNGTTVKTAFTPPANAVHSAAGEQTTRSQNGNADNTATADTLPDTNVAVGEAPSDDSATPISAEESQHADKATLDPAGLNADGRLMDGWRAAVIYGSDTAPEAIDGFIDANNAGGLKFVLLFDDSAEGLPASDLVWLGAANCDPVRDCRIHGRALILDARIKAGGVNGFGRPWPNVVIMDEATIHKVDSRWGEYGIGPWIQSPSLLYMKLTEGDDAEFSPGKR